MKQFSIILFILICWVSAFGQQDSGKSAAPTAPLQRSTEVHRATTTSSQARPKDTTNSSATPRRAASTSSVAPSRDTLTPEQIKAAAEAAEQAALEKRIDSIAASKKAAIIEGLKSSALNEGASRPNYQNYFPSYFYDNVHQNDSNALVKIHPYENRDLLFYAFMGISFLLGLTKVLFPSYFNQVFWFFLHPSDRKHNVSEQLQGQYILPSLLLNLLFVLTGGLFLTLIMQLSGEQFWKSWAVFTSLLAGIYLLKYLVILFSGWLFGTPIASTIYNQVVFSINKIIGLVLLPTTLLMSYGSARTSSHVLSTVTVIVGVLLLYRYIASFLLIKGKLKVSAFHFILYLCAVEIIPLLLVYKVLLTNMGRFM